MTMIMSGKLAVITPQKTNADAMKKWIYEGMSGIMAMPQMMKDQSKYPIAGMFT